MRRTVSGILLTLLLVCTLTLALAPASYVNVDVSQAKQMIESNPNLVILDVRAQGEYDSGHIQNATLIPVSELAGRLGELEKDRETLVYCAAGGRSATASQTLVDNGFLKVYNMLGGITAWKTAGYRIEIIHNGDLIVDETQTLVIENCTYIQNGSIYVKDSASLSLKNALLTFAARYGSQYIVNNIYAEDYATIRVDSSKVGYAGNFVLNGYANASIKHSALDNVGIESCGNSQLTIENSNFGELSIQDASQVFIENSTVTWIVDLTFDLAQVVYLNGLGAGYHENWNLHQNQTAQNVLYDLTLKDSVVAWGLWISEGTVVEIVSCEIERMGIKLYNMTDIKNVKSGYQEEFTFKSIVLRKSYVSGWHVMVFGTHITIENSEIRVWASGNSSILIVKSLIDMITAAPDSSITISFDAAMLIDYLTIIDCDVYACGNATFSINILSFVSSNFTRSYNILGEDRSGNPLENIELVLFDRSNKAIWTGFTDSFGKAGFNVTFTDSNYTDALKLEAVKGNLSVVQNITFLSDTPIMIVIGILGDINRDWTVDIYDAILLANAYNARLGDPNWNVNTDLNKDDIVDIYDAILLASNYGKKA